MYYKIALVIQSKAHYLIKAETQGRARQEAIGLAMDEFLVPRGDVKDALITSACCDEFGKCCVEEAP